jgi:SAM-dependent methyltransferase
VTTRATVGVQAPPRPAVLLGEALGGLRCRVVDEHGAQLPLPTARWVADAHPSDEGLLEECDAATLDVGCGPGRLTAALAARGVPALGIDVAAVAVAMARRRGAPVLCRDVFGPLPREGGWPRVLLADGNIGIGGDPWRLLHRVAALLGPGGRAVVEVAPPGRGLLRRRIRLEVDGPRGRRCSAWFPWATVGAESVGAVAETAGLRPSGVRERDGRFVALLEAAR